MINVNLQSIPCANTSLLERAFTHKSYYVENRQTAGGDNEKLEFLGDAVLDLVISELLLRQFPDDSEGDLSQKRSGLVNESVLAQVALTLAIGSNLKLGRGEEASGGAQKPRLLASALEAVIGAIFIDGGYSRASEFIQALFAERVAALQGPNFNYEDFKTRYQEYVQKFYKTTPIYEMVSESGPDHDKIFIVAVKINGEVKTSGEGKSKKAAEQAAAKQALLLIEDQPAEVTNGK